MIFFKRYSGQKESLFATWYLSERVKYLPHSSKYHTIWVPLITAKNLSIGSPPHLSTKYNIYSLGFPYHDMINSWDTAVIQETIQNIL